MATYLDSDIPGYDLCGVGRGGCEKDSHHDDGKRWCENTDDCTGKKGCGCHLFKRRRRIEGGKQNDWVHVADPGVKVDAILDPEPYDYECICVKKKAG